MEKIKGNTHAAQENDSVIHGNSNSNVSSLANIRLDFSYKNAKLQSQLNFKSKQTLTYYTLYKSIQRLK